MSADFLSLANPGLRQLKPYQPGKPIDELERELGISNIIKLASNENPLGASPRALQAVREQLQDLWLYPDGSGFALKEKLASRLGLEMAQITLGNGSSDILDFAVRSFVGSEHEVIFSEHAFAIYAILTHSVGARAVVVPARDWGHDLDAMAAAVNDRTRLVFIANPNNPTGTWLRAEALESFIARLPAQVMVLVDEAYFEYASFAGMGAEGYPSALAWLARYPNLIVARTFSKCYGLAGLRVGYGASHPDVADLMNRIRPPFNVNSLGLAAAAAALDDDEHRLQTLELNATGMRQLIEGFSALGLAFIPSVGNFISVDMGQDAAPLFDALLREGIIVRPVANYGMPRHLRITVGLPEENERLLAALKTILGR